jgi:hypothetical protein
VPVSEYSLINPLLIDLHQSAWAGGNRRFIACDLLTPVVAAGRRKFLTIRMSDSIRRVFNMLFHDFRAVIIIF